VIGGRCAARVAGGAVRRCWPLSFCALVLVAACSRPMERPVSLPDHQPLVTSNILRDDYAGSRKCADCHGAIYDAWEQSPMHRMTRHAQSASIEAAFDGATLRIAGDTATMEMRAGQRYVTIESAADGRHMYRVTKVIGGRYREDYAGVDVTAASDPVHGSGVERILPVTFVFSTRAWRYKGYSVMVPERTGIRVQVPWSKTCIACHNTMPSLELLYGDLIGPGAPVYQGRVTSELIPPSRAWTIAPVDEQGLAYAVAHEVSRIGGSAMSPAEPLVNVLRRAVAETRSHFGGDDLVEVGVGCEACHGGAAEHAADPAVLPSFALRSPLVRAIAPDRGEPSRAQQINRTCARCHTVLFSEYPWTWEGGRRADRVPGGSTTNSGEARDFALGGCASRMACTACHDPHAEDRRAELAKLSTPAGNAICAGCHPALATADGLRAHSHHAPGAGTACIACHMPKKNMGLAYELVRYHRIGSPTDPQRVLGDRPLECALCHQDKTVGQLVEAMERWWGKRYDRDKLSSLYGPLAANVVRSTLERGKPHEQAVAIGVLAERGTKQDIGAILPHLAHAYPLVRYFAKHAIETLSGGQVPVDVEQPAGDVRDQVRRWATP